MSSGVFASAIYGLHSWNSQLLKTLSPRWLYYRMKLNKETEFTQLLARNNVKEKVKCSVVKKITNEYKIVP